MDKAMSNVLTTVNERPRVVDMSCHYEEGALVHAPEDQLADCIVCGLSGCTDPDCDCGNKPAVEVTPEGMLIPDVIHVGACLAVFREGEIEIAALKAVAK